MAARSQDHAEGADGGAVGNSRRPRGGGLPCALTSRSTRARTGSAPQGARSPARLAARCRCVPVTSNVRKTNKMNSGQLHVEQKKRIRSFSTDKAGLRRLLEMLQERAYAAAEIEKHNFQRRPDQTDEMYGRAINEIGDGFGLFLTLSGIDGRKLTGNISEVFDSPNFPDEVRDVFFDTSTTLRSRYNYVPLNKMILFLDFGRPEVFNFTILPSQETRNESNLTVEGRDVTWVNGVFKEFFDFVQRRPSTAAWLHRHSVYDLMLWLVGFPLSFWICSKLSPHIESLFTQASVFLKSALYFYVFVLALNVLRVAFHYARWIWPLTEFQGERNATAKHKAFFAVLASGLGLPALYDVLKWLIH